MNDWDSLVHRSNKSCPKIDAKYCLTNYGYVLQWKRFHSILDIGCADGFVTANIISEYFNHSYKELVGVDCNENLIKYANENYSTETLTFKVLDIKMKNMPKEFEDRFDHICSFYCLNWLGNDQGIALSNIGKMMKTGGTILLYFMGDFPLCHLYKKLSRYYKYAPYMRDIGKKIPDYFYYINKEEWLKNLMVAHGFSVHFCHVLEKSCTYKSVDDFVEFMKSIKIFKIPEDLLDDYYKDLVRESRRMNLIILENNTEVVKVDYQVMVASGTKDLGFIQKIRSCCVRYSTLTNKAHI